MAARNFSPIQNLKWLKIKYNYTEHLIEVAFGKFICGNKVSHFKTALICHEQYILNRNKRSHDTENHCGYLIDFDLAKSPFVKSI